MLLPQCTSSNLTGKLVTESMLAIKIQSLEFSYCNVINFKEILLFPNNYILTCTSMMCDLQGLFG